MFENIDANNSPSQNDEQGNSYRDYLDRATRACAAGDAVLGMHLYLAAFEQALQGAQRFAPDEEAIAGLKQAWALACRLKERSLAEYIFEKLEPYLSADEVAACAEQLQRLALDKLQEFGLSREDLEDMTDMISQDFLGIDSARIMKIEHVTSPERPLRIVAKTEPKKPAAQNDGKDAVSDEKEAEPADAPVESAALAVKGDVSVPGDPDPQASLASMERLSYKDLVGYDEAVSLMRDFGVGMQDDPRFRDLVNMLNARYGLDRMPAADALLFRSPAREDANRFMMATLGELGLPALHMRMEENLQGMPVLCIMAQADNQPPLNSARNSFEGAGVLLIEDIDMWISPFGETSDDRDGFLFASMSRGAREAVSLIRSAVENPDVFVLASASESGEVDPFFLDVLEPLSIVDIDYPTDSERADIWMEIARDHPSFRGIDRARLVDFSANMPRFDIYMAAREAIEEAYKSSLVARRYRPVTTDNLYEKLAAYQPLDSDEYRALETALVKDFRTELEHLEDLLNGEEG